MRGVPAWAGADKELKARTEDVKKINWWSAIGLGILSAGLAGCGGGGSSNGDVRLINATLTHPSLDLLSSTDSSKLITAVTTGTVSSYVSVSSGSPTLQIDDTGSTTALVGTTPALAGSQHLAIIAYEIDGIVQPAFIAEDSANPATGNSALRVIDLAVDAGALNVYLTAVGVAPTSSTTPTFTISAPSQVTATSSLVAAPGTYSVWVTGPSSVADLRLEIPSITLGDSQNSTVILTPTTGGVLVNGSQLIQQGAYTPSPNKNARVRLAAAASNSSVVNVKAGSTAVATNVTSPSVTQYVLVPAASSALSVTVNGAAVTAPTTSFAAGTDSTVLVSGAPGAASVKVLADDNHASTTVGDARLRMVNGLTGTTSDLTLKAAFSILGTPVAPDSASSYFDVLGGSQIQIDVLSGTSAATIFTQTNVNLQASKVYTLFMLGDSATPIGDIVQDSPN